MLSLPRPTAGRRLKASSAECPLDAEIEGKFEGFRGLGFRGLGKPILIRTRDFFFRGGY